MIKKIFILPFMLIVLALSVFAYDVNDSITIKAEYKVNSVYTNVSDANISIYLPNVLINVDNIGMNYSDTGKWEYIYTIPDYEGEYNVIVEFYNNSIYKGNQTKTFNVGDVNTLKWNVQPTGTQGWVSLWILLIILIVLGIVGMVIKSSGLLLLSGIFLIFSSFITFYSGMIMGLFSVFTGLTFLMISASIKH